VGKFLLLVCFQSSLILDHNKRDKKRCPVADCRSVVIHLPRHLEDVHHWKPEKARTAVLTYGLRKPYSVNVKELNAKSKRRSRLCPMDNCTSLVKRLSPHLSDYHHLNKKSQLFRTMLVLARKRGKAQPGIEIDDETDFLPESDLSADELSGDDDLTTNDDVDDLNNNNAAIKAQLPTNDVVDDLIVDDLNNDNAEVEAQLPEYKSELPTDFLQFQTWLQSPDGGRKCEKSARQHAHQVGVIFAAIDSSKSSVCSLWCSKLLTKFLTADVVAKQFLPATTKSYLNSLRHWYSYILSEETDRITTEVKQQIQSTSSRVARWIASYRKDAAARNLEKMDDDITKLITPEKVALYARSEPAVEAIKWLGDLQDGSRETLTLTDYVQIRDFLLTEIIISNANRSGVLANMTLKQFQDVQLIDGSYVVSVTNHKTAWLYGPAKVVLTPVLYSWLSIFVKYVRIQITKRTTGCAQYLFLSWTGQQLESGQITRAIQASWNKAGLGSDISCTLMRKSAVSSIHQQHPEQAANLADLLCHSKETAAKSYRRVQRQHTSVAASTLLRQVMTAGGSSSSSSVGGSIAALENAESRDDCVNRLPEKSSAGASQDAESRDDGVSLPGKASTGAEFGEDDSDDTASDIVGPSVKSTKSLFNVDDTAIIQEACKDIIASGPISQKRIAEALGRCPEAQSVSQRFTVHQIISRIKYERRKMSAAPKYFVRM